MVGDSTRILHQDVVFSPYRIANFKACAYPRHHLRVSNIDRSHQVATFVNPHLRLGLLDQFYKVHLTLQRSQRGHRRLTSTEPHSGQRFISIELTA